MKVLIATAMYPTPQNPAFGSFVRTQIESLREIGIAVELMVLGGRIRKLAYPKAVFELRQRLAADPSIDLVHAHYGLVGMVARTQWKVPVVVTYHGSDLNGSFRPDGKPALSGRIEAAASKALAPLLDVAIVQSKRMAARIKGANVHIIPHEVDFETFQVVEREHARALLGLDPHKKYLLFAARPNNSVKNFPLARAAVTILMQKDPNTELLVVYKEPQDRLALYMNACDALVFPSFSEGSPNVVKQAMACNLPIVSTDVGDVEEVIGATRGCFICPPEPTAFATQLEAILARRERTRGREHIQHFDKPTVARAIVAAYQDALDRHRARRGIRVGVNT